MNAEPAPDLFMVEVCLAEWESSSRWYVDVLGLIPVLEDPERRFLLLQAGPGRIALKEGPAPGDRGAVRLIFQVRDVDVVRDHLIHQGGSRAVDPVTLVRSDLRGLPRLSNSPGEISMLAFVIATGLGLIGVADDAPKSVQERYQTLSKEYDTRLNAFYKEYFAAKTDVAKKEISRRSRPNQADYAHRFYLLAVEEPQGPAASDALYEVLQLQPDQLTPEGAEAFARLRRDFATSPKMGNYIQQLSMRPWPCVEPMLREVLDHSPDRTARGQACLGLAGKLASRAAISKYMNDPEMAHRYRENYGEDYIQAILKEDPEANLRESTALYERVLAEFADVRFFPAFPHDKSTLRKHAETWLAAQSDLAIGKPAPEIEGTDVDGKPFKLSDYRGKVVVLVFWASWCGPCMQQIPSERELLKKMAGRPFALLGVNCDYKVARAKKALLEEQVIWPNWYDGDPRDGKIASRYHIQGIPAVFVLDAEGIIREKEVRGVPLEAAVEDLLKKQSTSKGAAPIR